MRYSFRFYYSTGFFLLLSIHHISCLHAKQTLTNKGRPSFPRSSSFSSLSPNTVEDIFSEDNGNNSRLRSLSQAASPVFNTFDNTSSHSSQSPTTTRASTMITSSTTAMAMTILNTKCKNIRLEDFKAKLELSYYYLVETTASTKSPVAVPGQREDLVHPDVLFEIENEINQGVAAALNDCDDMDRPLFAVEVTRLSDQQKQEQQEKEEEQEQQQQQLDHEQDDQQLKQKQERRHEVTHTGYCMAFVEGNTCNIVFGYTAILLDNDAAEAQKRAYETIEKILEDRPLLSEAHGSYNSTATLTASYNGNKGALVRTGFIRSARESLTILSNGNGSDQPGGTGSNTSKAVIAAAVVALFLVSVFFTTSVFRKRKHREEYHRDGKQNQRRHSSKSSKSGKSQQKKQMKSRQGALKKYFMLDDDYCDISNFRVVDIEPNTIESPSITWSISDITSESGSIRSSISRTTSKLEPIDEVEEEVPSDEEAPKNCTSIVIGSDYDVEAYYCNSSYYGSGGGITNEATDSSFITSQPDPDPMGMMMVDMESHENFIRSALASRSDPFEPHLYDESDDNILDEEESHFLGEETSYRRHNHCLNHQRYNSRDSYNYSNWDAIANIITNNDEMNVEEPDGCRFLDDYDEEQLVRQLQYPDLKTSEAMEISSSSSDDSYRPDGRNGQQPKLPLAITVPIITTTSTDEYQRKLIVYDTSTPARKGVTLEDEVGTKKADNNNVIVVNINNYQDDECRQLFIRILKELHKSQMQRRLMY